MEETKRILLTHFRRYPQMQIEDFIKLIYQNTFGPKHFGDNPTISYIKTFLTDELTSSTYYHETPYYEVIGSDYVRVSLKAITENKLSIDELAKYFMKTIDTTSNPTENTYTIFDQKISLLLTLIKEGRIHLPYAESIAFIQTYQANKILPIHHSEVYKKNYHPHYRVVKKSFINKH